VSTDYACGQQSVGIDLHRRRSVIVRMNREGERLETVRIVNDVDRLRAVLARAGESPEVVLEATYGWVRREGACVQVGGTVGGSADEVEGVVPGPVRDGLSPPRRASRVTAGCGARGPSRSGPCSTRGPRARRRPAGSREAPGSRVAASHPGVMGERE
jgi:hypothetical protein